MNAIDALTRLREDLTELRRQVRAETGDRIARQSIRTGAERIGTFWFAQAQPLLIGSLLADDVLNRYSADFKRLIKISSPNNRKASYIETLEALTKRFRTELLLPLQTAPPAAKDATTFDELFVGLGETNTDEYLKEAVACARKNFLRAAAVLGWCAAIDRIHRVIEKIGFPKFNVASATMASQTQGRFKRFNKPQNVSSIDDLRMVFDTDVLWILEGMRLIDPNEHTRLRSCFDLRNHSAHPGEAPVSEYNLLSFFSDIIKIVLQNPKFSIVDESAGLP